PCTDHEQPRNDSDDDALDNDVIWYTNQIVQTTVDLQCADTEGHRDPDDGGEYCKNINYDAKNAIDPVPEYRAEGFGKQAAFPFSELGICKRQCHNAIHRPGVEAVVQECGTHRFQNSCIRLWIGGRR